MKATLEQVAEQALGLSSKDRAALTRILIEALDSELTDHPVEVEEAWQLEIEKRVEEVLSGRVKTIPAEEVFSKLRAKYE
jgi:putative addiction module component (TIGR02574 family)